MDEPSLAVDMPGLLQAEEAQKLRLLRKRMKAESLRLLDMERRQKQRVEEIREVQKQVCNLTFLFTEITNYCYLLPSIALALMLFEHINNFFCPSYQTPINWCLLWKPFCHNYVLSGLFVMLN